MKRVISLALVCALCGCHQTVQRRPEFLREFADAAPQIYAPGLLWYEYAGVGWPRYKRLHINSPLVSIAAEQVYHHVNPEALREIAQTLRGEVLAVLGQDYVFAEELAPDVVQVSLAVTDLIAPTPERGAASTTAGLLPVGIRGSVIEVQLTDGLTGAPLAAVRDERIGKARPLEFYTGFTSREYLRRAFSAWAGELRALLAEKLSPAKAPAAADAGGGEPPPQPSADGVPREWQSELDRLLDLSVPASEAPVEEAAPDASQSNPAPAH